ncbi:class I SAM-dependent methyltransferase [Flavobacterium gawalongense]|uniref:Class I SAM-dependent methyltransferase n=1 Tax=Flavobacterium gawalongense TaxID=2594432 RepID=A0A553BZ97_9FLAO|nr:class I SAM-dependent methyltransferase [Flavobacterium gawalongense]TRX13473.1 class I SAM-dependent methyltransferase [Flavobacterium gawalongense]TRX15595.1 class I SAM-dependent methyltransferase [Flavobacterium gawalongense]TRX31433.1 class I SAM-dependent methyltransferase [Flavobacterium gawalongense]
MKHLTTLDYWTKAHGNINIELNSNDLIKKWISNYIDFKKIKSVFEIGCYPGRYLTIFGDQGVEVNGVDYIKDVSKLPDMFKLKKYKVGQFYNSDFFEFTPDNKYDCVMSLGFIEHFHNWEKTMINHFDFINDNGYLIIEVPNFRGLLQRIPRMLFDYKNYKRHNLDSMNLEAWNRILIENDFEIIYSGYFGGYILWFEVEQEKRINRLFKKYIIRFLTFIRKIFFHSKDESSCFSCAIGIIAKKK